MLAGLIATHLADADESDPPLLVPVPLHRWRLWKRGYNQAALLARELAKLGKGELMLEGLERHRVTPSLGGLGRSARQRAIAGSIRVPKSRQARIRGRDVILVDDVMTSGATSEVCVGALLKAGARSVQIACFARVLDEALDAAA
ncbi:ComF family protein [Altererythrobacter lutimaris]